MPLQRQRTSTCTEQWGSSRTGALALRSLILLIAAAAACGPGAETSVTTQSVDSTGLPVTRNAGEGLWAGDSPWRFEEDLRIGGISAPIEAQFGQVSATAGVAIGADGTVFILDSQAREVRAFDTDGAYLRTIGGPGEGPGEFGEAVWSILAGDDGSIIIPDLINQSIHRFNGDGTYLDSPRLEAVGTDFGAFIPVRWDRLSDGRIVAQVRSLAFAFPGGIGGEQEADILVALDASGSPTDTVMILEAGESLSGLAQGLPQLTLFAPEPVWAAGPNGEIITARTDAYRLTVWDGTGTPLRVIERDRTPRFISEAEQDRLREVLIEALSAQFPPGAPSPAQLIGQFLNFAETYPLFSRILVGPDGTIWIQETQDPEDALASLGADGFELQAITGATFGGRALSVFDSDGALLGEMLMPERFQPVIWDGESLYGVQLDELDVQTVVRLVLVRGSDAE